MRDKRGTMSWTRLTPSSNFSHSEILRYRNLDPTAIAEISNFVQVKLRFIPADKRSRKPSVNIRSTHKYTGSNFDINPCIDEFRICSASALQVTSNLIYSAWQGFTGLAEWSRERVNNVHLYISEGIRLVSSG